MRKSLALALLLALLCDLIPESYKGRRNECYYLTSIAADESGGCERITEEPLVERCLAEVGEG